MPKRRKKTLNIPYATLCIALVVIYVGTILLWPMQSVSATERTASIDTGAAPTLQFPAYGQTAIGTDTASILATHGDQQPVPIASITKIITVLVVLEKKPLQAKQTGPTITLTQNDAALFEKYYAMQGMVARAEPGMQLTQYEMMQAMLITSANNYADTLVTWAYGSMDAYLQAANEYLKENNLPNTSVADASGFSPQSKSTATDLVKLGSLALKQSVVADIVSQPSATINGVGTIRNTNLLLGSDGYIGIKTGTTDEAGSCLLYAVKRTIGDSTATIIGATLGAPNHPLLARNVSTLVDQTFDSFKEVTLTEKNQMLATYHTDWAGNIHAVATKKVSAAVWPGQNITTNIMTQKIKSSNALSDTVGTATFDTGTQRYSVDLILEKPLSPPSWLWKLTHPFAVVKN